MSPDNTGHDNATREQPARTRPVNGAEEVLGRMREGLLAKDMDAVAGLWSPDGTAEFPFAEAGSPRRLDGREAIRAYLAGYPQMFDVSEVELARVHQTADPDTAVAELTSRGRAVTTGAAYRMDYIVVLAVRDGLIHSYRDYWSPVQVERARGALPRLAEALLAEGTR
jgi:ketosteroid isomerase-like protein